MDIIYATTNEGKKTQVQNFLTYNNYNVKILTLKDIDFKEEIEENISHIPFQNIFNLILPGTPLEAF